MKERKAGEEIFLAEKEWEEERQLQNKIEEEVMRYLDVSCEVRDEEIYRLIDEAIKKVSQGMYLPIHKKLNVREKVYHSMRGLDVLTPLLQDEEITEIMINGYNRIFVESKGRIKQVPLQFRDEQKYHDVIQQIVSDANRIVNESSPIVDARLADGSRVNVVLSPIALDGSTMTIRKFPKEALTIEKLIEYGSLSEEIALYLKYLVVSGYNIIISGGTGSGKTTFLNALSNFIPKEERIITIEDSAELQLRNVDNLVRLEVRNANVEGLNGITMTDLIKSSLRMRPDRIIVGEVRGEEALDMLQALNTGHDGSISTAHANSAKDLLSRVETMVLMGFDMPMNALRGQIASALEIVIHLGRLRDHSRRVLEITEVVGTENGEIICNPLFVFQEQEVNMTSQDKGNVQENQDFHTVQVQGQLLYYHELKQVQKLRESGYYEKYCGLIKEIKAKI